MADPGEGPGGAQPPPLFLDQKGAQRAEKNVFETGPPPYLKVWIATDNGTTGAGKISRDYTSCEMHTD